MNFSRINGAILAFALCPSIFAAGTLVVEVKAMPHPDAKRPVKDAYTGKSETDAYGLERVDYKKLDEIVVYAVPSTEAKPDTDAPRPVPAPFAIDARPLNPGERSPLVVSSVGATLRLTNTSDQPQTIYCVADGNALEFKDVPPGETREAPLAATGLIELMLDSSDEPIARVFIAPTPWVKAVKSGDDITFEGLPAGPCKVVSWHPRLPGVERDVTIKEKKRAKAEVSVGMREAGLPKVDQ